MMTEALAKARRIVVKIGSSSLTRADGGLNLNRIDTVARLAAQWQGSGREIVIVSSGAVAAGLAPLGLERRPKDLAHVQAAAAMGQGLLIAHWSTAFQSHHRHAAQVLLTTADIMRRDHYTNARQALERLLAYGVVPIINENDAVTTREVRFGDNDRLAAHVAQLVGADVLVLLTDVDGLYTAPPTHEGAQFISEVKTSDDIADLLITGAGSAVGSGGMVTKVQAASMATCAGIGVILANADQIADVLTGHRVGTWFHPTSSRPASRTLWIAYAAQSQGELFIDEGAVHAITVGKKSLLAAGIRGVHGNFISGDVVDIVGEKGLVARGLTAYDWETVEAILGGSREDLVAQGWENPRPVIHRDDLAIIV
ncbi:MULTISPECIES: glutamate 5-kinase [unclassified Schaalia]|uniref:glutamate 5-kinase n=1 Tax=unclassified Schaalia TaxID=2691889 RepID=UPI001E5B647D|nr:MULTISPECIES: glutamate 5-kinase [unclassified Schaalia]MCD4549196.1 glutamate 5-kinase [Schaalia sp. lx-260]MCD4557349.1 glutamate 5-kinase [Schaalia sp. lx-100]